MRYIATVELPAANIRAEFERIELELIHVASEICFANKSRMAKFLGMNRTTLVEKMRKYGLPLQAPRPRKLLPVVEISE